jgi:hypothetical protein
MQDERLNRMDVLERALIEKADCENSWEHVLESNDTVVWTGMQPTASLQLLERGDSGKQLTCSHND